LNNQQTTNWTRIARNAAITLAIACYAISAVAQTQDAGAKSSPEIYQTFYLTNLTQPNDASDLEKALRNNLSNNARLMYVPSQNAITIRASAEDIALAQKILSDLDKTRKIYRLTYAMKESDGGKTIGLQHFSIIVASGSMTVFKQGSRVPVFTNSSNQGEKQVTYLDVGLEIEASLDGYLDGVRLRTKIVQSGIAEEKSSVGTEDPIIRQTTLEGTSTLVQGKPLVLGSLDVPGSTRHQEVEVVSELLR
jgi:type II secretory pathway component GspD/PulD (secretin)